jgi:hypothetical protein
LNGAFASLYADDVALFYCNSGAFCGSGKVYQSYLLKINSGQDLRLAQADIFGDLPEDKAAGKKTGKVKDTIEAEGYSTTKKVLEHKFKKYDGSHPDGLAGGSDRESDGDTGGDTGGDTSGDTGGGKGDGKGDGKGGGKGHIKGGSKVHVKGGSKGGDN